jgi:type II secretory pathway component PulJ
VTLLEMLVTVAVLVILMTILVQVFQAATGSVSAAQAIQQLDDKLRRLDGLIRGDLDGATARFTPPLDPAQNLGYFEYIENEFADKQGEDSDDCLRFTAKAPPGRPFTGRMWVTAPSVAPTFYNETVQPVTITSDYAEIIYFLRNGNLYRRVLLINPELQSSIVPTISTPNFPNLGYLPNGNTFNFQPGIFGGLSVSWQGVNDLSARPAATGPNMNSNPNPQTQASQVIILNTLGDLTNRENRFASPRFANDFWNVNGGAAGGSGAAGRDGIPDDVNGDNIPDLYPSLYSGIFNPHNSQLGPGVTWRLNFEPNFFANPGDAFLAFPWIYPGAYSYPQVPANTAYGWIHSPTPVVLDLQGRAHQLDSKNPAIYLQNLNHNPLDVGDNLTIPDRDPLGLRTYYSLHQTWWGFPTWRETLSLNWVDPTWQVNAQLRQPYGLKQRLASDLQQPLVLGVSSGSVQNDIDLLPPMSVQGNDNWPTGIDFSIIRRTPQLFGDIAAGINSFFMGGHTVNEAPLWAASWEDDLILTGVRSFDVKAYDNALADYADLGWGDDVRMQAWAPNAFWGYVSQQTPPVPFLAGNPDYSGNQSPVYPPLAVIQGSFWDYINQTFAHEGRMPPLVADNRVDASTPNPNYPGLSPLAGTVPNSQHYNGNVGDDNVGVIRLRRVWDSWSTEYSRAPATGIDVGATGTGFPWGPPFTPPIYPSYPPPYPAPLRGIQIQLRVVDPTNQRIKSLTIREDFTDKL